ncbi:MAG: metallophosphoesterase [Saprospirales bacterium]|nr:metallophosphoesterase [Saprospirales bacterium]MBK6905177.1 metallophosphoesterase [Saprospirales bacterium]MBK7335159.1 metallophosphoesterase [Saprospirales bacterium]
MPLRAFAFLAVFLGIIFAIDWYVFQGIRTLTAPMQPAALRKGLRWAYWVISIGLPALMFFALFTADRSKGITPLMSYSASFFITLFVTKLVFLVVLFGGDIARVVEGVVNRIKGPAEETAFLPERRRFVSMLALGIASIPFASFLYGIAKGKYLYKVHRHTLFFDDLPTAFDGFTITQISDVHSGSFDDQEAVRRGVEMAQAQQSDLFVFTGDLVNNAAIEFEPYLEMFKQLRAPFGQFSIFGNHDYGDYTPWPTEEDKVANLDRLKEYHRQAGFRLLLDEHVMIEKDGQQLALLGVENWGVGFGKRGDLKKASEGLPQDTFKILLSHDPTHWDHEVKSFDNPVQLTLSGHTHGMQVGLEIPGFRWSPSQYRYPKWAGVYEEAGRMLHINRGFGFLGFSGRVGIWPEITVLELKKRVS